MKSLLLLICMFIVGSSWACGDEWETRKDEMQAQFDESIEAECEAGKNRKYNGELVPLCQKD